MTDLMKIGFTSAAGIVYRDDSCIGLTYRADKIMYTHVSFMASLEFKTEEYFVLEYKANGLRRFNHTRQPVISLLSGDQKTTLAVCEDIIIDGEKHSLILKCDELHADGMCVEYILRTMWAEFNIYRMAFCASDELPECLSSYRTEKLHDFKPVDLAPYYNAEFKHADDDCMIDSGRYFTDERMNICGVPFSLKTHGNNIIVPSPAPAENDDEIINFGVKAKRRLCRPVSRDSLTVIPLGLPAKEIFFVLTLAGSAYQRWGFGESNPTILGDLQNEVMMPFSVEDTECFMIEIQYADDLVDTAFPYNITVGRHIVCGEVGVYAVPANGSVVKNIIFHNRLFGSDLSIAAITINNTDNRLLPDLVPPVEPAAPDHMVSNRFGLNLAGNILTAANGAVKMVFDISDAMNLIAFENDYTPVFGFAPGPLLCIKDGEGNIGGDIEFVKADVQYSRAFIKYKSRMLELTIEISLDGKDNIEFLLHTENTGDGMARTGIVFPRFSCMRYTDRSDSWYLFPKCRNLISNEDACLYEESSPTFPMQFIDIYSPAQNGGLALTTKERGVTVRNYSLTKCDTGIEVYVEYPYIYGDLQAGESFTGSSTVITAHEGDWHSAFNLYKNWLDSWYKPYKSQNKEWYRRSFWLLAEITDFFETNEFVKFPVWYDEEKAKANFLDILQEQKEITGILPDILHLWQWTYDKQLGHMKWGNFGDIDGGGSDYDAYGGKEAFRDALQEVEDKTGLHMSLYLHPTLLTETYPKTAEYMPHLCVRDSAGGKIGLLNNTFRMCHANAEWRKEAISFYPRIYKELGVKILYVDEFSLRIGNRCWATGHGHHVPSNLIETDRDFITELREIMPEEVVLYGEYAAVDVNAAYIDCNITYHIIDIVMDMCEAAAWRYNNGDDTYSAVITDLYRFAFPKIVQLNLPMAMRNRSWHPQKFIFWNGEAIYDSFWDNEESAGLAFTVQAYKLKKEYADCFSSDHPKTMIKTLTPSLCMNEFPGENRTLYTIYNRAYVTYRGPVLSVPHKEGNVYYDAWNQKPLDFDISNGKAILKTEIHAQQIGCFVILQT
ncbi:MAG: DUF6259 domain-containing protein [Eubacteriales bacterium]